MQLEPPRRVDPRPIGCAISHVIAAPSLQRESHAPSVTCDVRHAGRRFVSIREPSTGGRGRAAPTLPREYTNDDKHMRLRPTALAATLALALALAAPLAQAQANSALKASVEKALGTSPEVNARFNAWLAAGDATDAARAGFRPRVDLDARVAQNRDRITGRNPENQSLSHNGVGLTLTQLLWDGLATSGEVERLNHDRMARYFELLDATEQTALEAARAHLDVQRFRRLVQLAEDNYVQLRYAYLQIQSRVRAGVGRGVDLEQAAARVALAESNLGTEVANLHDVTARYLRIVGEAPAANLPKVESQAKALPATGYAAMAIALRDNAAISASIESLRAAREAARSREGGYQPRVEARLRGAAGRNLDGVQDQKRDTTAEIVLNWNLYNGGADQARVRQAARLVDQAADLRDKICRDTRQTAGIAFNDTRKLVEQLAYLDRNVIAIEKARDAYRQQFDIGQRSLLDLLNAENELFTARRAYANAESDLAVAEMRALAAMGKLMPQLGISRNTALPNEDAGWKAGDDLPTRCPTLTAEVVTTPRAELDAQAQRLLQEAPKPAR
jgi:adhesin transport system outer membrane protein